VEKSCSIIWDTFVIFEKLREESNRKLAQSGHPVLNAVCSKFTKAVYGSLLNLLIRSI
jgi:hypothetical protein